MAETARSTNTLSWREAWRRPQTWGVVVISLSLLTWVLWRANLGDVWRALRSADYSLIVLGIPVILIGLMVRAMRWRILLLPLGKLSFWASFRSMLVGYLANNLLPARAGELVRAYVLGRQVCISKSAILATVVVERIIDGLIMLLALSSLLTVFPMPAWVRQIAVGSAAVFVGTIVVLIAIRNGRERIVSLLHPLLTLLPKRWQDRGVSLVDNFLVGLTSFRSPSEVVLYSLMTIMVWSTDVLLFWLVIQAFSISLAIPAVVLVLAAGALSTAVPALPGYVGTYQFVLVNILTFLGVVAGPATAFALGVHGVTWLTVNIVGAVCALQLGVALGQQQGSTAASQDVIGQMIHPCTGGD